MMRKRRSSTLVAKTLLIGILSVALLGCPSDSVNIRLGTLEVFAVTTGAAPDPDGYVARVRGGAFDVTMPVPVNGSAFFVVTPGDYSVALEDVAPGCVTQDNPRSAAVRDGITTDTTFEVVCS